MKYSDLIFGSGIFILVYGLINIIFKVEFIEPIVLVFIGVINIMLGWMMILALKNTKEVTGK